MHIYKSVNITKRTNNFTQHHLEAVAQIVNFYDATNSSLLT